MCTSINTDNNPTDNGSVKKKPEADFGLLSLRTTATERETESGGGSLCCCQYIDQDSKRFHMLTCCCDCEDFDLVCTRLVTCKGIDQKNKNNMLITFQNRLRIPWRGGARKISLETVVPAVGLPIIFGLAAINAYTSVIMLISTIIFMGYGLLMVTRGSGTRTRFFLMWLMFSIGYMVLIFEFTVPLLELLPEENFVLIVTAFFSLVFLWRAKKFAPCNHITQTTEKDELPGITEATRAEEEEGNDKTQTTLLLDDEDDDDVDLLRHQTDICDICRKYMPPRTDHCPICGVCVLQRDHHSYWLNCCIGEKNHRFYVFGLLFGLLALFLGANLTLTAVCHPFLVIRFFGMPIMLPDDCTEVFDDYELSLSFVIAGYGLHMGLYVMYALMRQLYFISRGVTITESKRGHNGNRKSFLTNWKKFLR